MKVVLYIILIYFALSLPNSSSINIENLKEKRKQLFDKLFECLNDLGTESFKKIINENKDQKILDILKNHKVSLTNQDKNTIKECRKQILLDSKNNNLNYDNFINNKVNLKKSKLIVNNK